MSCFLCGSEEGHHLGCLVAVKPDLTPALAVELGLLARPKGAKVAPEPIVEVLREGSMTTVPEVEALVCEFGGCDNPKKSNHPRVKYCEGHSDPKNRKE